MVDDGGFRLFLFELHCQVSSSWSCTELETASFPTDCTTVLYSTAALQVVEGPHHRWLSPSSTVLPLCADDDALCLPRCGWVGGCKGKLISPSPSPSLSPSPLSLSPSSDCLHGGLGARFNLTIIYSQRRQFLQSSNASKATGAVFAAPASVTLVNQVGRPHDSHTTLSITVAYLSPSCIGRRTLPYGIGRRRRHLASCGRRGGGSTPGPSRKTLGRYRTV